MKLPFFGSKKRKQVQQPKQKSHISGFKFGGKNSVANERVRKRARDRMVLLARIVIIGTIVGIIGLLSVGVLAGAAISLKTGEKSSVLGYVQTQLKNSPLGRFLPEDKKVTINDVIGVNEVPEYPSSDFVFGNSIARTEQGFNIDLKTYTQQDQQELYRFFGSGQSIYFVPIGTKWKDVTDYYKKELPKRGWEFKQSVGIEDLERVPGEYFSKNDIGLHIYQISDDIWYETITKAQAESGLKDRVLAYKTKQLLVESSKGSDVPPETWWTLRYSSDWDYTMAKHLILGEYLFSLRNKKTGVKLNVNPLKRYKDNPADVEYKTLEDIGTEYIKTWLTSQPPSVSVSNFSPNRITIDGVKAVEYVSAKDKAAFAFVINKEDKITYVIEYFGDANTDFYEYVKANIHAIKKP